MPSRLAAIETGRTAGTKIFLNMLLDVFEKTNSATEELNERVEFTSRSLPIDMTAPPPLNLSVFFYTGYNIKLTGMLWYRADLLSSEGAAALRQSFDKVISIALMHPEVPLANLDALRSRSLAVHDEIADTTA